ncbi:MAG TPA: hypothetical protein VGF88_17460 [Acidobacteriaceae bacterium]
MPPVAVWTEGIGAASVLECVGTQELMTQAIRSARLGGSVGYDGVSHGVELDAGNLFFKLVGYSRWYRACALLPTRLDQVRLGTKDQSGKVFNLIFPIEQVSSALC